MTTQANSAAIESSQINGSGILQPVGGGTGLTSPGTSGNLLTSDGTVWTSQAAPTTGRLLNIQYFFHTGSASVPTTYTYTPTTGTSYVIVTVLGGGGGGAASASYNGNFGESSVFSGRLIGSPVQYIVVANGGAGGSATGSFFPGAGLGGTATGGDLNISGGCGEGYINVGSPAPRPATLVYGGRGGASFFGGAGKPQAGTYVGGDGEDNTGGGGAGGSYNTDPQNTAGAGGGAGGYAIKQYTLIPSYIYTVIVANGGTGGGAIAPQVTGGRGGSGMVIIEEYN